MAQHNLPSNNLLARLRSEDNSLLVKYGQLTNPHNKLSTTTFCAADLNFEN